MDFIDMTEKYILSRHEAAMIQFQVSVVLYYKLLPQRRRLAMSAVVVLDSGRPPVPSSVPLWYTFTLYYMLGIKLSMILNVFCPTIAVVALVVGFVGVCT